ncbi:MAG: non-heme iron oxygenase ferredoxin subunit [Candidatus Heimdallarchaeota archaeon]|nr:non-heme iron oxygenase ferredoxin subunit [Candidatus Heimdallarchaeota archaeon]MBY8995462.1 non-heme iron oxygenase ferredoxin subunit [Candidatus Heimdallarchaeota archaeon]
MSKIKLCSVSEIPENAVKTFKIENKDIAVFKVEGKFYAIDRLCTHMKGNLVKGKLEDKTIKCPLHGSVFSLESGELLSPPGTVAGWFKKAKNTHIYETSVQDDFLFVEIKD